LSICPSFLILPRIGHRMPLFQFCNVLYHKVPTAIEDLSQKAIIAPCTIALGKQYSEKIKYTKCLD